MNNKELEETLTPEQRIKQLELAVSALIKLLGVKKNSEWPYGNDEVRTSPQEINLEDDEIEALRELKGGWI